MGQDVGVETLDRSRRRMLWGLLVGFGCWQAFDLAAKVLPPGGLVRPVPQVLVGISLLGWLYWCVNLIRMIRWQRQVRRDPSAAAALEDEFTREARFKAFAAGFWLLLLLQAPFLLAPVSSAIAAQASILVGVSGGILAFQYFSRG